MKKVLIFGISGFVGYYLAQEFISNGYDVYGSDVVKNDKLPEQVVFYQGNLLVMNEVKEIIKDITPHIVINLAAISSVGYSWEVPQTTIMVNVVGALNIMESVRLCNPKTRIMFIGSSEEYEASSEPLDENAKLNSNNPYGISKIAQENYAKVYRERYRMQIYCVRSFNHTGIGQKDSFVLPSFCKQVAEIEKSGKPGVIRVGNLAVKRDFSDVRDIVRAYRMIVEKGDYKIIYNIGSSTAYSLEETLKYIITLSTQKITLEIDETRFRPTDTDIVCSDSSLVKNYLGWSPEITIFETIKGMYEYFLSK